MDILKMRVYNMNERFGMITLKDSPAQDRGGCDQCRWAGDISSCQIKREGSLEEGYYDVYLCPVCLDTSLTDYWYSNEEILFW